MLKFIFALFMLMHGLIHIMGFTKAFNYGKLTSISTEVSKVEGILWLLATLLFCVSTLLFLVEKDGWWVLTLISIIVSQLLIYSAWKDAKFGSIANLIVLFMVIIYKIF